MSLDKFQNCDDKKLYQPSQENPYQEYQIQNQYEKAKFINPHDIAGTKNLVEVQNDELNMKKIQFRMHNEAYLRAHPEINQLISVFMFKVLEEKPNNILEYAGKFFDQFFIIYFRDQLKQIVDIEQKHYT